MIQSGIYYVQRGQSGFLSDSEWDGDCFTQSPVHAIKRTEPWSEGRGMVRYECVKVRIDHSIIAQHPGPVLKSHTTSGLSRHKGRTRYRVECPRCRATTKGYATEESAFAAWNAMDKKCVVTTATVIQETPGKETT